MALLYTFFKSVGIIYALLAVLCVVMQPRLIFQPDKRSYTQEAVGVEGFEDVRMKTHDGLELHGWYAPARDGMKTLLFFHGNASSWQWRAPDFVPALKAGFGVLLAGYRGYGGNPGAPSEEDFYADSRVWLAALADDRRIPLSSIVLYGESLGTGVAVDLAAATPGLGGLVLEAPYTSMPDLGAYHYRWLPFARQLTRVRFDSLSKIGQSRAPVLFLVGERDRIVPPFLSRRLFEAAQAPKRMESFPQAGHNDMRDLGAMDVVLRFAASPPGRAF